MLNLYLVNLPRVFPVDLEKCQAIALENRILKCLLIILLPLKKKLRREAFLELSHNDSDHVCQFTVCSS